MRTKTLLLTAALSAAGIATSMAQAVYSVNAVGYVNTTLTPGFNLISNPLDNKTGNTVANLLGSANLPDGTGIYVFKNGSFDIGAVDFGEIGPASVANSVIEPGNGFFVRNTTAGNLTVTFVGEVPQGQNLTTTIPVGFSILASKVPQAGTADSLGLTGTEGDVYYSWGEQAQSFNFQSQYDFGAWAPPLPTLAVGEAFFYLSRANAPRQWTRNFVINQ
jgi:hypothetical protein